jgi:hypothetical protein
MGHPVLVMAGCLEKQIPFGNDNKKSKGKGKSNRRSFDCALRASLRMTRFFQKVLRLRPSGFAQDDKSEFDGILRFS